MKHGWVVKGIGKHEIPHYSYYYLLKHKVEDEKDDEKEREKL